MTVEVKRYWGQWPGWIRRWGMIGVGVLMVLGLNTWISWPPPVQAEEPPLLISQAPGSQLDRFCRQSPEAIANKEQLRREAEQSDQAWARYTQVVAQHRQDLDRCRQTQWPRIQATWLRLYPCDIQAGVLDHVFDQIVNLGYNRVFIEAFYDGNTILPSPDGQPWPSLDPEADLLDLALRSARQRGLSAYAWLFSLNFGYTYSQLPDRQSALALNGSGQTSLLDPTTATLQDFVEDVGPDQVFVDPYSPLARQDFRSLLQQVLRRQPDGVLFDYIRYPRQAGAASVAGTVKDLWVYGESARNAFLNLGLNAPGKALLQTYLDQGFITVADLTALDARYGPRPPLWRQPLQPEPLVETEIQAELRRSSPVPSSPSPTGETTPGAPEATPSPTPTPTPAAAVRHAQLQPQLWQLAVEFAHQGILDYLHSMSDLVTAQEIPAGAVFFPDGNRRVGEIGYDSRLQPWDRFDPELEWHVMAYARCEDLGCVGDQVEQVIQESTAGTLVCPALAGLWGESLRKRPMLEVQMQELQQRFPQLPCVSHFAFSWVAAELNEARRTCTANL